MNSFEKVKLLRDIFMNTEFMIHTFTRSELPASRKDRVVSIDIKVKRN